MPLASRSTHVTLTFVQQIQSSLFRDPIRKEGLRFTLSRNANTQMRETRLQVHERNRREEDIDTTVIVLGVNTP